MPFCCRISRSNLTICLIVIVGAFHSGPSICRAADESLGVYFEQLRVRGLFSIAESYAVSRLAQPNIARTRRIDLTIELSRTLAAHAEFASEQQQPELWKQARTVVDEDGNETTQYVPWAVDKTAFTFHLIAGWKAHEKIIQEQQAIIQQLQADVAALKAK